MTRRRRLAASAAILAAAVLGDVARPGAHAGPPYPIVSNQIAGPYRVSVWTDPDATDDGSPGGQFWVMLDPVEEGRSVAAGTEVQVSLRPRGRPGAAPSADAVPENGNAARQFAALPMDHEGRFDVLVRVRGPLGVGEVRSEVEATYDTRPPPLTLLLYLMPFLVVGGFWVKMLLRRRRAPQTDR